MKRNQVMMSRIFQCHLLKFALWKCLMLCLSTTSLLENIILLPLGKALNVKCRGLGKYQLLIPLAKALFNGGHINIEGSNINYHSLKRSQVIKAINTLDVQEPDSLQTAFKNINTIISQYVKAATGSNLGKTRERRMADILIAIDVFQEFALRYGRYHLTLSKHVSFTNEKMDLQVRRIFNERESDFQLKETNGQNHIKIPSENLSSGSLIVGVLLKDLHALFSTDPAESDVINKSSEVLNTIIMSAAIDPQPARLQRNVTLMFSNEKEATKKRSCVFWNFQSGSPLGWFGRGCHVKSMDDSMTECSCNHLTHFAVLMQLVTNRPSKILSILTKVGLALSLTGISLTVICYVTFMELKTPLCQIRVCLVCSLGAAQIIFLAGIGAQENKGACVAVAALIQYFLMAAFCWMLIEGIYFYLFVVKVYNIGSYEKILHGFSWGLPAVMVAISLSIAAGKEGIKSFVSNEYCWMSSSSRPFWLFVSFVVGIELFNVLILVRVVKELITMDQVKDKQEEQIRIGVKACVVMVPLLGVTWLFGLLSSTHEAFAYIFTVFNSTQGAFIFLLHCVRNAQIREKFKRRMGVIFPARMDGISNAKWGSRVSEAHGNISELGNVDAISTIQGQN